MDDKKTIDANTNVNPNNNISIINVGKLKKKPHNITIKNLIPMNLKFDNPKFYIVISKNIADTKPRQNRSYLVRLQLMKRMI